MAERIQWRPIRSDLAGYPYRGFFAEQALGCIPELAGVVTQMALEAAWLRYPWLTPPDGLALLGEDRKIIRGPYEGEDAYRPRVAQWRQLNRLQGLHLGMLAAIQGYLAPAYPRVRMVTRASTWYTLESRGVLLGPDAVASIEVTASGDGSPPFSYIPPLPDLGAGEVPATAFYEYAPPAPNWDWDSNAPLPGAFYGDFWIVVSPVHFPLVGNYDSAINYDGPYTWGFDEPQGTFDALRAIVHQYKSAQSRPVAIIFCDDVLDLDPTLPPGSAGSPDGYWSKPVKLVNDTWVPTRNPQWRYIDFI